MFAILIALLVLVALNALVAVGLYFRPIQNDNTVIFWNFRD
jgi:hypothetical protein